MVRYCAFVVLLFSCKSINKNTKTTILNPQVKAAENKSDTSVHDSSLVINKVKPYHEVVPQRVKTDSGLFIIHRVDGKILFEIQNKLLDQDILIVTRISKAAANIRPFNSMMGYSGDQLGESIVRFTKGADSKLFLISVSYLERSLDSSQNGLFRTVYNSNLNPIVASFDIKAYARDSSGCVIDVTDYLKNDNSFLFFNSSIRKIFGLGGLHPDKSYILDIRSFPINVELQTVNTYAMGETTATYELNTSIVLLPKIAMQPRYHDERVGYFSRQYMDYDNPQGVRPTNMIARWRLIPKKEDIGKYLRGELVEPEKPIIFYVDSSTPKKWIPFLIQGVNDWQRAFEKAGFKNAIFALEIPDEDPEFSLLDARHNAIIYKPAVAANASGPHISDPRSGEILESHINWYHNLVQLLHDWYMIQAGPNDPNAQKMIFDDSLMGKLMRFVVSHEVGHTLGLMHNFGASSTVPVDSLRSKSYLNSNGFCPSIMDYARFNYVVQPEDGISESGIFPRIGVYDEWAIEWGYRWLPQLKSREEEKAYMNKWIIASLERNPQLWYGTQQIIGVSDPRCQSEDLGDDATKASYYGIKNLQKVNKQLIAWTTQPNQNFESLQRLFNHLSVQFQRYIFHVSNNIGLYTWTPKTTEQPGSVVGFIPKTKQRAAVKFLVDHLFETPTWLLNDQIFSLVGGYGSNLPAIIQMNVLEDLLNFTRYSRMVYFHTQYPNEAYTFDELLTDLGKDIFKEIRGRSKIDFCRRNLQRIFVEQLILMNSTAPVEIGNPFEQSALKFKLRSDYLAIVYEHCVKLERTLSAGLIFYQHDKESYRHLISLRNRLKKALDPNTVLFDSKIYPQKELPINGIRVQPEFFFELCGPSVKFSESLTSKNCWQ